MLGIIGLALMVIMLAVFLAALVVTPVVVLHAWLRKQQQRRLELRRLLVL